MFDNASFSTDSFSTDAFWLELVAVLTNIFGRRLRITVDDTALHLSVSDQPFEIRTKP